MGFFGSIGLGDLSAARVTTAQRQANAAAKRAAAAAAQAAKKAAADAKQLAAAQAKSNQTVALQTKEAGLQAAISAFQGGATVKQAATAQKQATTAAKAAIKAGGNANFQTPGLAPGTDQGIVPGAGMATGGTNYVIGPPATTAPSAITPSPTPFYPQTPSFPGGFAPPPGGGGGYGGGGGFAPPPSGGYSVAPPAGGYAIGGPQGAPGAYAPMTEVAPQYAVGPQSPGFNTLVPQAPYGTAIGQTPYSQSYGIAAPVGGYGIGAIGQAAYGNVGGIVNYTTARPGDTKACTNKRTALSKAYQKALKAIQKNPNSKAMTNFQKRYPKLVTALQNKCPTTGYGNIIGGYPPGLYPQQQQCAIGFQRNPAFNPSFPRNPQTNPLCVFGQQQPYQYPGYPGGFQTPPSYPNYPGGSGPQPGETVWQGGGYAGGGYQGGAYTLSPEGAPYAGMAPGSAGSYGPPPGGAVLGPVSNRGGGGGGYTNPSGGAGYADVPIVTSDVFEGEHLDNNVLAMTETGTEDSLNTGTPDQFEQAQFSGLGHGHHHHGSRGGFAVPVDYGGDTTVIVLDSRDCSPEDELCDTSGLTGLGMVVGRPRGRRLHGLGTRPLYASHKRHAHKRTLPMLAMSH